MNAQWPLPAYGGSAILSPEGLGALKAVLNNRGSAGDESVFGSVLATISLTVGGHLIAFLTGNELRFGLGAPEMVVIASLVLCHISFSTGRTNVLNGAAHMALFAAYLMTIFADAPTGGSGKPAGFDAGGLTDAVRLTCWYPARRSFSPDRQSLSSV